MSSLLTSYENRSYLNSEIVPFKGNYIYTDTNNKVQRYLFVYKSDGELWTNIPHTIKSKFITKFKLLIEMDDLTKEGISKLFKQYEPNIIESEKFKNRPRIATAKRVKVLNSFMSPMNNKIIQQGTIFKSINSGSKALGFKSNTLQSIIDLNNGEWKINQLSTAKFEVIS